MTTDETDAEGAAEVPEDNAPAARDLSRTDRIFIRLSVLNTVLALAGVFTGAVALYAAIVESEAVRRQSAAAVWPFVQFSTSDRVDADGTPYFSMQLSNAGVGPAKIVSIRVGIDGEAKRNWADVISTIAPESGPNFGNSFAMNRVLRPGEMVRMVETTDPEIYQAFIEASANPANTFTYCFCSIFDECWVADSSTDIQKPEPVDQCPDFGGETFRN